MSGMRYRTFLAYNAVGGIVWGTTFVLIGFGAGTSYAAVAKTVGTYSLGILAAVVVGVVVYVVVRRRRDRRTWGGGAVARGEDST
jgi:membrane-associated protein